MSAKPDVPAVEGSHRLSAIAAALEEAYLTLGQRWPELPQVTVTVFRARGTGLRGYFAAQAWQCHAGALPEIHIDSTILNEPPEGLLVTLVHEAVHARAAALRIQDTSRSGRYHNSRFADLAEAMGLMVTRVPSIGFTTPALQPAWLSGPYAPLLGLIDRASRRLWQDTGRPPLEATTPLPPVLAPDHSGRMLKATCRCQRPRIIRIARATLMGAPIVCGACQGRFGLDV